MNGLREEKNEKAYKYTKQKIYLHQNFLDWQYGALRKFGPDHEMNLKGFLYY